MTAVRVVAFIAAMRLLAGLVIVVFVAFVLAQTVFRPAPAADRLAGVSVAVAGYKIVPQPSDRSELLLTVKLTSARDLDECLGFTLDLPFAHRRLTTTSGSCARPQAGSSTVNLRYRLSDDDLAFPSHTLVWGIPGGRCGLILELFGVASSTRPAPPISSCHPTRSALVTAARLVLPVLLVRAALTTSELTLDAAERTGIRAWKSITPTNDGRSSMRAIRVAGEGSHAR